MEVAVLSGGVEGGGEREQVQSSQDLECFSQNVAEFQYKSLKKTFEKTL